MKRIKKQQEAGFTLLEMVVVIVLVAVLATIAAPSFLAMLNRQRLADAQAEAMSAIREAQAKARQQKVPWQACFKDENNQVRWFVSPVRDTADNCNTQGAWNNLIETDSKVVQIDTASSNLDNGFYRVAFLSNGWVDPRLAPADSNADVRKITLKLRNQNDGSRRCVYVATLLGAVRTGKDNDCNQ
ncbi:Tfp pilus assembly protein FimT/FimU [Floridanema evergladense]|uniref:Tfp pilus assembly protein FimT/FimU n=1 Tax=Floridaenema evergladense BLCC-F167 TaxID=3153639 RepID=A0ABV4WRD2_9CYAN